MNCLEIPQPMDIILGRGKSYSKHPGNLIFQEFIRTNRLRYFESSFAGKRSIIDEIIHNIQSQGGRFVRMKDNGWSIIPAKACRLKIAHAIQYHIRTEFAQGLDIPVSSNNTEDIMKARAVPEEQLSYQSRIVDDLHAKLSWIHAQQAANELARSYNSMANNNLQLFGLNSNVHQTESLSGDQVNTKNGRDSPSTTGVQYNVVSPFVERRVSKPAAYFATRDSPMKESQVKVFPAEMMNGRLDWTNELNRYYETCESLRQHLPPSSLPKFGINPTTIQSPRPMTQLQPTHGDSASVMVYPVYPDVMDHGTSNLYSTESFCNPISELASSYYRSNMNSLDYRYYLQKYGPQNQFPTPNTANDTPTNLCPSSSYDPNDKLELQQIDFLEDSKSTKMPTFAQIPTLVRMPSCHHYDDDLDLFPIDLSRDVDPFSMNSEGDGADEHVNGQPYHP